jgi:flagellar biosynthetic protein FliQ
MRMQDFVMQIGGEAIYLTILVSLPAIATSLIIGVAVALFSATTQIQEQTLSFAPKMIAVYVAILATGSWVGSLMINFALKCFNEIPSIVAR